AVAVSRRASPGAARASTAAAARPGRTSTRLTAWAVPAITIPASSRSSGRSRSAAPAARPAAEIPNSLTAPLVTSPCRSAPRWARNPRRGSRAPATSSYAPQAPATSTAAPAAGRTAPAPTAAASATAGPACSVTVRPAWLRRSHRAGPPGGRARSAAAASRVTAPAAPAVGAVAARAAKAACGGRPVIRSAWAPRPDGPSDLRPGRLQQFLRVRPGRLGVLLAGQHPGQLPDALLAFEHLHTGAGDRSVVGLLHQHLPVGERRHRRQTRHHHDLRGLRQPRQAPADLQRRLAADTC